MIRALFAACLLSGLVPGSAIAAECAAATVHLVRHAEKALSDTDPDVVLSEAGQRRADALVGWFDGKPLEAIYTTHLRRTQLTAAPLAAARDLDLRVLPAGDTARLLRRLRSDHCGEHVLVVGHSNTVPEIAAALGASPFTIGETDFGQVFTLDGSPSRLQRSAFGATAH